MPPIPCSLGIMAHNEAANIGRLLARVGASRLEQVAVAEIIVVASGCTDDTEAIVREAAAADSAHPPHQPADTRGQGVGHEPFPARRRLRRAHPQ
jgi:glycosyltransferase involved in cell wall biosynthesis